MDWIAFALFSSSIEATPAAPADAAHSKVSDVFEISRVRRAHCTAELDPVGLNRADFL
jgi:hypothetical protein